MDLDVTLWLFLGLALGVGLGFFGNPVNRAKILKGLTKKNYGLLRLTRAGNNVKLFIVDFGKIAADSYVIKLGERDFVVDPDMIVSESGLPCVAFDERDAYPLVQTKTVVDKERSPTALNAVFESFAAVTLMRMLRPLVPKMEKMLLFCLIASAVGAAIALLGLIFVYNDVEGAKQMIFENHQLLANLTTAIRR